MAFFGLGMNNPKIIATILGESTDNADINTPVISTADKRIILINNAKGSLLTVSLGAILGTLALILVIDRISRRRLLIYSFLGLAALFVVIAISFEAAMHKRAHILTIVLFGLCQFVFNFGKFMNPHPTGLVQ